jgi:predicted AAA+ superfamily ATPase
MARATRVLVAEAERFISGAMRNRLQKDLQQNKMVKEADLESCVYYHLRRFLGADQRWRILARKYSPKVKRYPDLLIYRKGEPKIAVELKWMPEEISEKDRGTLRSCIERLNVNKAYFICTALDRSHYKKLRESKRPNEKYVLRECVVYLDLSPYSGPRSQDHFSSAIS